MARLSPADEAVALLCSKSVAAWRAMPNESVKVKRAREAVNEILNEYQSIKLGFKTKTVVQLTLRQLRQFERLTSELAKLCEASPNLFFSKIRTEAVLHGCVNQAAEFLRLCQKAPDRQDGLHLVGNLARGAIQALTSPDDQVRVHRIAYLRRQLLLRAASTFAGFYGGMALTRGSKGHLQRFVVAIWKAAGEKRELKDRQIREELHHILPRIRATRRNEIRQIAFAAAAAGIRGSDPPVIPRPIWPK